MYCVALPIFFIENFFIIFIAKYLLYSKYFDCNMKLNQEIIVLCIVTNFNVKSDLGDSLHPPHYHHHRHHAHLQNDSGHSTSLYFIWKFRSLAVISLIYRFPLCAAPRS